MQGQPENDALLTPSEVAAMFRVNPKTVTRWARAGKISAIRTLGGHRRFRASEIRRFLEQVEEHEARSEPQRRSESGGRARSAPTSRRRRLSDETRSDDRASVSCTAVVSRVAGGRDRRRSGDPTLFRRVLCRLSYPAGHGRAVRLVRRS